MGTDSPLSTEKHLTDEKLAEYRELVQYGSLIGVGGSALASLLDEIERLRARVCAVERENRILHRDPKVDAMWRRYEDWREKHADELTQDTRRPDASS